MLISSNLLNRIHRCKQKQRSGWDGPFKAPRTLPPNGFSWGQTKTFAYSTQCSGKRGVWAMVHRGKFTWCVRRHLFLLVYTKPVNIHFRALWLATQARGLTAIHLSLTFEFFKSLPKCFLYNFVGERSASEASCPKDCPTDILSVRTQLNLWFTQLPIKIWIGPYLSCVVVLCAATTIS